MPRNQNVKGHLAYNDYCVGKSYDCGDSGHRIKSKKDKEAAAKKKKASVKTVSTVSTAPTTPASAEVALPSDVAMVNFAQALTGETMEQITKVAT